MGSYLTYVIGALFILLLLLLLLLPSILIRLFLVLLVENGDDHCKIWEREKKKKTFQAQLLSRPLCSYDQHWKQPSNFNNIIIKILPKRS